MVLEFGKVLNSKQWFSTLGEKAEVAATNFLILYMFVSMS
jgi:hypothetical protein